jgi:hypothetical protein
LCCSVNGASAGPALQRLSVTENASDRVSARDRMAGIRLVVVIYARRPRAATAAAHACTSAAPAIASLPKLVAGSISTKPDVVVSPLL